MEKCERMCVKLKPIKLINLYFFLATFFLTINLLTYQALDLAAYKNILRFAGLGLYIMTIIMGIRHIRWKLGLMLVFGYSVSMFLLGSSEMAGNAINMTAIILIVLAAQCIDYEDLRRIFYEVALLSIVVWILLIVTEKIHITIWEAYRLDGIGSEMQTYETVRYSLGFLYEINLGAWYLTSALTIAVFCRGIARNRIIVVTILNIIIYIVSDSRTTIGFYALFVIFYYFFHYYKNANAVINFFNWRLKTIYAIIFIVPALAGVIMEYIPWMDRFLSGRLWGLADRMSEMSSFNYLFGWFNSPLACFYYMLLSQFGIFVYVYFYFVFKNSSNYYLSYKKFGEFAMILSLAIVGLIEGSIFAVEELSTIVFWSLIGRGFAESAHAKDEVRLTAFRYRVIKHNLRITWNARG